MAPYDILGNILLVKFERGTKLLAKKKTARKLLQQHNQVTTILEKTNKISGRLRTPETKYLLGDKTKEVLYHENGCQFRFNVDTSYFSPRLASERKEIAELVKPGEKVMVLFAGVSPFPIVIAKSKKASKVVSVEINKSASKYALENVKRNKVNVEVIQGDVRLRVPKMKDKFDRIVMARPNLKDDFLDVAFKKIEKNGIIHYYGFYDEDKLADLEQLIMTRAIESKKKIKILKIKKAGDIGTRKYRYRADILVNS